MMLSQKIDRENQPFIIFSIILFVGTIIRIGLVSFSDFPLNDGGLFYSMVNDLVANHFHLPLITSYNHNNIPFAYPALSLYFAGLLNYFGIDLLPIMRFFPLIFNILTIPAFYSLCSRLLKNKNEVLFATLTFAVLPPAYEWLIMGGGLTRSPAYLLSILAWNNSFSFIKTHSKKDLFFTIILTGLSGLCHIEICMITVIFILLTFLYKDNFIKRIKYGVIFLCGVFLVMTPYFYSIIQNHGVAPLKAALFSGEFDQWKSITRLLVGNISGEAFYTPLIIISLLGLGVCLQKKDYLIPLFLLAVVIFNPRSMDRSLVFPMSFLSGIGFNEIIYPYFSKTKFQDTTYHPNEVNKKVRISMTWVGLILISYLIIRSAITSMAFLMIPGASLNHVSQDDRNAMFWVRGNTDKNEKFLILSKTTTWQTDYRSEWFPALADRKSITTVQGSEWLDGGLYYAMQDLHEDVSKCFNSNLNCLNDVNSKYDLDYSMVYLSGKLSNDAGNITPYPLEIEMRASPDYHLVYENDLVSIFSYTK